MRPLNVDAGKNPKGANMGLSFVQDTLVPEDSTSKVSIARKRAMLICNGTFSSLPVFLPGVAKDAENLTRVLGDPETCGFEVTCLLDKGLLEVRRAVAEACATSNVDDTLLIYCSGSSFLDEQVGLQLPVADTHDDYRSATCLDSEFVLSQMRHSCCQRFVLIIDGCHSGAFFRNNRGIPDGLVALTSCSADEVCGDTVDGGVFTQSFLRALTSPQCDRDHDGCVTVDEVFEFIRREKRRDGIVSHPQKWVWNLPESIVLVRNLPSVFMSYSSTDSAVADRLVKSLESSGVRVWRDVSGVVGGTDWVKSLAEAVSKSNAVLFLMTEASLKSKWVERELVYADQEKSLPIMPVIFGDVKTPEWYSLQFGRIQRSLIDSNDWDQSVQRIATSIRQMVFESSCKATVQ